MYICICGFFEELGTFLFFVYTDIENAQKLVVKTVPKTALFHLTYKRVYIFYILFTMNENI